MKSHTLFIGFAALFGMLAVVIGSFGAHIIGKDLSTEALQRINTGLDYQFYHVAALLAVGVLSSLHRNYSSTLLKISGLTFILGIVLFSGSLYAYSMTGNVSFVKITPIGGSCFLIGWVALFLYSFRK